MKNKILLGILLISLTSCDISDYIPTDIFNNSDSSSKSIDHEHIYADSNDYIKLQQCEICKEYGRNKPTNEFLDDFNYTYAASYKNDYDKLVDEIEDLIASASTKSNSELYNLNETILDKISVIVGMIDYISNQYSIAELYSYKYNNEYWNEQYDLTYSNYYDLYTKTNILENHIFKSRLKEIYFAGEDLDELEKYFSAFEDDTVSTLESSIHELEEKAYFDDYDYDALFNNDVENLLKLRNQLANLYGYDNYYDYAYINDYSRCYGSNEVKYFRKFVKQYFVPLFEKMYDTYAKNYRKIVTISDKYFNEKAFESVELMGILDDYLKSMNSLEYDMNMYDIVNEYFKRGSIFIGEENGKSGAFTNSFSSFGNYNYFANEYYYLGLNALVHEFGHAMIDFNEYPLADYDLYETHSQSNEILLLKYLDDILDADTSYYLDFYYIFDSLNTIILTCAIDEIEECLYKNYCDYNYRFKDGISKDEYALLVDAIFNGYGTHSENWKYYFTQSSCYCISYAVSLVPCLGLYYDVYNPEKKYFKILNYYKDEAFYLIFEDQYYDYLDVLDYCGYYSPFDEELYQLISANN